MYAWHNGQNCRTQTHSIFSSSCGISAASAKISENLGSTYKDIVARSSYTVLLIKGSPTATGFPYYYTVFAKMLPGDSSCFGFVNHTIE
jgi:hypothetical protein